MTNSTNRMPTWSPNTYWVELIMDDGSTHGFAEDGETLFEAWDAAIETATNHGMRPAGLESITEESVGWFENDRASELGI